MARQITEDDIVFFDPFNLSELVEIAKSCDIPGFHRSGTTKGYPRRMLIEAILLLKPIDVPPPIMDERVRLSTWARERWNRIKSQALYRRCPECVNGIMDWKTSRQERCSDLQVMACWLANKHMVDP